MSHRFPGGQKYEKLKGIFLRNVEIRNKIIWGQETEVIGSDDQTIRRFS